MPWGQLLEDPAVCASFERLEQQQQTVVITACLYRQLRLIEAFDLRYAEPLSPVFIRGLNSALTNDPDTQQRISEEVMGCIPDTDVYSGQEGGYAQNLLIALSYFLDFLQNKDVSALHSCTRMLLENRDLIQFEADERYNETAVFADEVRIILELIEAVRRTGVEGYADTCGVARLASGYMI